MLPNGGTLAPQRAEQIQLPALPDTPTVILGGARLSQADPAPYGRVPRP